MAATALARLARRLALSGVVLGLVLAGAEAAARARWTRADLVINPVHAVLRDHPTLFWVYEPSADITRPNCPPQRTNALGLRDDEVVMPKPPGTRRILSLGESTTFGAWVGQRESYSEVLQQLMGVDVVNAGTEAWTVWQSAVYLSERGLALDPDLVLVYHEFNDFLPRGVVNEHEYLYKVEQTDRELYERRRPFAPLLSLLYRSHLYLAVRKRMLGLPTDLPTVQQAIREHIELDVRVPEADRRAALEWMLRETRAKGVQLVILKPTYPGDWNNPRGDLLRRFATENDLLYVDLPAARRAAGMWNDERFFVDRVHPNAQGHRVLAEAIAAALKGSAADP